MTVTVTVTATVVEMESIKRLIVCLGYPKSESFDISKESSVANLVIW